MAGLCPHCAQRACTYARRRTSRICYFSMKLDYLSHCTMVLPTSLGHSDMNQLLRNVHFLISSKLGLFHVMPIVLNCWASEVVYLRWNAAIDRDRI